MSERNRLIMMGSRARLRLAADDRLVALVRRGERLAFEILYERHAGGLLSFCTYMLGSRHDAEDAVQATFASAYRALRANERPVVLRPWLFAIARNDCLSVMRKRRPAAELNAEPALRGDPLRELELHEEVRHLLENLRRLPEPQRAALVLAELHGLSQAEIGVVLAVQPEQVKAYIYQARSNLISEKRAQEADCREIREELATARGAALLRGRLRRHVRSCEDCRVYADGVARQRRHLGALLPLAPSLLLKYRALEEALGLGGTDPAPYAGGATIAGSVAGAAVEIAGGGIKALAVKVAAGAAILGATAGVGASVLSAPAPLPGHAHASTRTRSVESQPLASVPAASSAGWSSSVPVGDAQAGGEPLEAGPHDTRPAKLRTQQGSATPEGGGGADKGGGSAPGGSAHEGRGAQGAGHSPQKGEHPHESRNAHRKASEEHARQNQGRQQESKEDRQESKVANEEHQQQKAEERARKDEERDHEREERERIGGSPPPRANGESQLAHEEHQQKREEREPHGKEREAGS